MSEKLRRPDPYELAELLPAPRFIVLYDSAGNGKLSLRGRDEPRLYKTFNGAKRIAVGEDRRGEPKRAPGAVLFFELTRLTPIINPDEIKRLSRRPFVDLTLDISEHELAERMTQKWAEYALCCKGLF